MLFENPARLEFVAGLHETVEEAHGHGFDRFACHVFRGVLDSLAIEFDDLPAITIDTFGNADAQVPWNQHRGKGRAMVPHVLADATPDFQTVTETLRDEHADPRTGAFEHRVGGDGRAMNEGLASCEQRFGFHAETFRTRVERPQHALGGVIGCRKDLDDVKRAIGIKEHEIGECSADVYANSKFCSQFSHNLSFLLCFPSRSIFRIFPRSVVTVSMAQADSTQYKT